jgi:hypothetical protein
MPWVSPTNVATGDVLTASKWNQDVVENTASLYARDGLVLIKSQTVGSAVSNVPVTNAFSATYDAYRIVIAGTTASTAAEGRITFGAASSGYYYSYNYTNYGSATNAAVSGSNVAFISYVIGFEGSGAGGIIDVVNPFAARWTRVSTTYVGSANTGPTTGVLQNTTSYTDFTITPASGTITGGTITVFGYVRS